MRRASLLLALGLLVLGGAGCTSVRNGLGPRVGICFNALPAARRVVGRSPHFDGVRYVTPRMVAIALARELHRFPPEVPDAFSDVFRRPECLVAFRGAPVRPLRQQVWRPEGGQPRFTIVVVHQANQQVLGVVLLPRLPLSFAQL